jgi:trehalose/maltose hydrolase-like predicted phosphorylase
MAVFGDTCTGRSARRPAACTWRRSAHVQALVFGFAGIRPSDSSLAMDPRLPSTWEELSLRLRYHRRRAGVRAGHDTLEGTADGPVPVDRWEVAP